MSGFWLTPAAPGNVATTYLAQVHELHDVIRAWLGASATAQKNPSINANAPYTDLMFAFGFATLGDSDSANRLIEDARRVLVVPVPDRWENNAAFEATVHAVGSNFLFNAFRYRIEEALAGKPLAGPLSAELLAVRETITQRANVGGVNSPLLRAALVIDRFRECSRIVEPQERVDPYTFWTKTDSLALALRQLRALTDPIAITHGIRELLTRAVSGKSAEEARVMVLTDALPIAARVSEELTVELLNAIPAVGIANVKAVSIRLIDLLESGFLFAGNFGRADVIGRLSDALIRVVQLTSEESRAWLIARLTGCVATLKNLGFASEADQLVSALRKEVTHGETLPELQARLAGKPEQWAGVLRALLSLPDSDESTRAYWEVARTELLGREAISYDPRIYTGLARAYITSLGQAGSDLSAVTKLFSEMSPTKITNTWTTAEYYSRFHILLIEDTVAATCKLAVTSR